MAVAEEKLAIKLNPHNADAHWCLGTLLLCLDKPQEAANAWRAALKINPKLATSKNCNCKGITKFS